MNCWEILGIDPTGDPAAIDRAYEQQKKFAAGEELNRLHQAYREARGEPAETQSAEPEGVPRSDDESGPEIELSAEERQVVREVAIQVKALLNDSRRLADEGIWRAILAEPPADQSHIRSAIANDLEPQIRPMAANGAFPSPVIAFLADWFGWAELQSGHQTPERQAPDKSHAEPANTGTEEEPQSPATNFWPAVVGWVVALAVLAAVFDSIFSG
jgi:hypothetical protein